jgi:hypothetical protein
LPTGRSRARRLFPVGAPAHRADAVALLCNVIEAARRVYVSANDQRLSLTMEITRAQEQYARRSLDYVREKNAFARNLSIPDACGSPTIEPRGRQARMRPRPVHSALISGCPRP